MGEDVRERVVARFVEAIQLHERADATWVQAVADAHAAGIPAGLVAAGVRDAGISRLEVHLRIVNDISTAPPNQ